ncbi:HAD family hydrolase [Pseudoroseicyclus aestuarii]|uniref:HAD superfamily hydrolase (TIGR01509 family) n=1 Tax=Pseudoroseicyclus aestuarii TaxID=1795041 RepID=A0A318TCY1_9RHOB|nr:HAD-IA family hydrolase [Pseudoroseicyclus aestuarii]PYE86168.1 HAD superfamily hydrolase (TIGR01509 family) [Pseudoroseicyclus aestuarii]
MAPDLLILDCDGVLIDSEVLSAQVLLALLAERGLTLDAEHVRRHFLGRSFPTVAAHIREAFGLDLPDSFEADYRARLLARFDAELRPMPYVLEVLPRLRVPWCVATSSSPQRTARALQVAGLDALHPRVFTASEVARGKPAPDLFEHAARVMGAAPAGCLVVEDSAPGLAAARAAGMAAVHFTGGAHLQGARFDTPPGVLSLDDWRDLPALIEGETG